MRQASLQREARKLLPLLAAVPLVACAVWLFPQDSAAHDSAPGSGSLPLQEVPQDASPQEDVRDERA